LVLGDAIATASWLDGFFAAILDGQTTLVLVSSLEDTITHASFALRERNRAVLWCADLVALSAGSLQPIGAISEADRTTFDTVARHGELLVEDVAEALGLTVPAAQQRLNSLIELRLLVRERVGRPYVYRLAAVDLPAMEPA
jgi:DNA-binding transcriptional ArsR family regulator